MKTIISILIIFVSSSTHADDAWITDILEFTSGVVTAYGVHELGHCAAGWATNTEMIWHAGSKYNQPLHFNENASSHKDAVIVNAAGLASQVLLSEAILQSDLDKNSPFVRGMMAWNIVNPIIYALDYWLIRNTNGDGEHGERYRGDIEGIEYHSSERNANIFAVGMLAIAANQGYRMLQTQDWALDWLRRDDIQFNFSAINRSITLIIRVEL